MHWIDQLGRKCYATYTDSPPEAHQPFHKTVEMNRLSHTLPLLSAVLLAHLVSCGILQAQTQTDSLTLSTDRWDTLEVHQGLVVSKTALRLFDSEQQLYRMDINPRLFYLQPIQPTKRQKVKRMGKKNGATAAINGGYFITKTHKAIASYFLKIDNTIARYTNGWGEAAIAMDSTKALTFINQLSQIATQDPTWHRPYPNVLSAGPMLICDGRQLILSPQKQDKRHPRTVIGIQSDSTITLLVVDGRQRGAEGMTRVELAWTCRVLGMKEALNLDGGGSSTMWSQRQRNINHPSDRILFVRIPRKVANAILILPKGSQ